MAKQVLARALGVTEIELVSEVDGLVLRGVRMPATRPLEGLVVIAHGAAEHVRRYLRFAEALAEYGFETWALDHRGHGRSPGPDGLGDTGRGGWDGLVADLAQVVRAARATHPDAPLALFGHSMGSFAAQHCASEHSDLLDALILSGSTDFELPDEVTELPPIDFNVAFPDARTAYDWLSRDGAEVDKYIDDPLCGFEAVAPVFSASNLRHLSAPATVARIRNDLPVFMLAGDQDPLSTILMGVTPLADKYRRAGIERVDLKTYAGGRHEMLNELNRDEVTADIIDWLRTAMRSAAVRRSGVRGTQ